jgi:hypothetical protein
MKRNDGLNLGSYIVFCVYYITQPDWKGHLSRTPRARHTSRRDNHKDDLITQKHGASNDQKTNGSLTLIIRHNP